MILDPYFPLCVFMVLVKAGVRCSLRTGEDVREVPGAEHYACTIEMSNLNKRYDVAVIDEIQVQ